MTMVNTSTYYLLFFMLQITPLRIATAKAGSDHQESLQRQLSAQVEIVNKSQSKYKVEARELIVQAAQAFDENRLTEGQKFMADAQALLLDRQQWAEFSHAIDAKLNAGITRRTLSEKEHQLVLALAQRLRSDNTLNMKNTGTDPVDFERYTITYFLITEFVDIAIKQRFVSHFGLKKEFRKTREQYQKLIEQSVTDSKKNKTLATTSLSQFLPLQEKWKKIDRLATTQVMLEGAVTRKLQITTLQNFGYETNLDTSINHIDEAIKLYKQEDVRAANLSASAALRTLFPIRITAKFDDNILSHLLKIKLTIKYFENQPEYFSNDFTSKLTSLYETITSSTKESVTPYMTEFQRIVSKRLEDTNSLPDDFSEIAPKIRPGMIKNRMKNFLYEVLKKLNYAEKGFQKNQGFVASYQKSYNTAVNKSIEDVHKNVALLEHTIAFSEEPHAVANLFKYHDRVKFLLRSYFEAIATRSNNVDDYGRLIIRKLQQLPSQRKGLFINADDRNQLTQIFAVDVKEARDNAIYTKENSYRLAIGLSVITLGLAYIPSAAALSVTYGGATILSTAGVVTAANIASRATFFATSSLSTAERFHRNGILALTNYGTYIDIFTAFASLPRVIAGPITATSWYGKLFQTTKNHFGMYQVEAAAMVWISQGLIGAYEVYNAEALAKQLSLEEGRHVTAGDVRLQGMRNILIAVIMQRINAKVYQQGRARHGEAFDEVISPWKMKNSPTLKRLRNITRYPSAVKESFTQFSNKPVNNWLKPFTYAAGAGSAAWTALSVPAQSWVFLNEMSLFSYTNLDKNYTSTVLDAEPLPDLIDNEIAVLAVGFDKSDILYTGALANGSTLTERVKYGNEKFKTITFKDPMDLFTQLQELSQQYGPVKYLKIATHGLPGMLFTLAAHTSGTPDNADDEHTEGWINTEFLTKNKAELQSIARETFAENTRVILFSCLTGGNYDTHGESKAQDTVAAVGDAIESGLEKATSALPTILKYEKSETPSYEDPKIGDTFLDALSDVVLVNKGRIDASRRILVGLDTVYGSVIWKGYVNNREINGQSQRIIPMTRFEESPNGSSFMELSLEENLRIQEEMNQDANSEAMGEDFKLELIPAPMLISGITMHNQSTAVETTRAAAKSMVRMLKYMPRATWRYGVKLEGPWWHNRYNYRVVR